ncbi:hypothetical protein T4A_6499 [Trichinella pseudospiralis]|uniref:Secreted protein n=1 Tax=Trichinella pseudospiralis TaxID=6337 RepID=A0A0V1ENA2_TRIPS|nr:hypothetical protein T4A_6499 [Trichinella pseudospiralis]KRZ40804.1 hypothetical protein T4C_11201 [Trichinella pseudospiralis]
MNNFLLPLFGKITVLHLITALPNSHLDKEWDAQLLLYCTIAYPVILNCIENESVIQSQPLAKKTFWLINSRKGCLWGALGTTPKT